MVALVPSFLGSVSPITIAKFMVKKPLSDPVRIIASRNSKVPIVSSVLVTSLGYHRHRVVLRPLLNVRPIIWSFSLAVLLEMSLVGDQPVVDDIGLFL